MTAPFTLGYHNLKPAFADNYQLMLFATNYYECAESFFIMTEGPLISFLS